MPGPWEKYGAPQQPAQQPGFRVYGEPDPYKVSAEQRAGASDSRAADAAARAAATEAERLRLDRGRFDLEQRRFQAERNKDKPPQLSKEALHEARLEAASKINAVRRIRRRLDNDGGIMQGDILPETGPLAAGMAAVGWPSNASDIESDFKVLRSSGSLAKVTELMRTLGKNPFTPMSNYESELLAGSIGNLSLRQSPESLKTQLDEYERLYTSAYRGVGGNPKALNPKAAQPKPGGKPAMKVPKGWSVEVED